MYWAKWCSWWTRRGERGPGGCERGSPPTRIWKSWRDCWKATRWCPAPTDCCPRTSKTGTGSRKRPWGRTSWTLEAKDELLAMLISRTDIRRYYRVGTEEVHALQGVSFAVEKGEWVAIVGQSGSGKSTLMNVIGCLDTPTSGRYILNGKDVSRISDDELANVRNVEIGFIFQTFQLLARETALANVELPLVYRGMKAKERHERAKAALDKVH